MSVRIRVDEETVGDRFTGVMIPVREPWGDVHHVPGWRCKQCGWTVVACGIPATHYCPADGETQAAKRAEAPPCP